MNKKIFYVLLISLLVRIVYLFLDKNLWWDAAVYLSMGKYMVSFGQLGLWEPIRPLLWPFILSYGYILGIDPVFWGHIFSTFFSLSCIYLVYCIGKKLYNERTAILASVLLSGTWVFFFFNARLYTEIPAVFFALCAYYFFLKEKPFETGIFTALAFLTKFPEGLILGVFLLAYMKSIKKMFWLILGFSLMVFPYFAFNYFAYGSSINNLFFAQEFLKYAGIWIFQQPWWYYFAALFKENFLLFFALPGILFAFYKKKYSLGIITMFFFVYFSQMAHKELRFAILFLPFLCILAAYGYQKIFKETQSFMIIVLLLFFVHAQLEGEDKNEYFSYLAEKKVDGEILVAHPLSAFYAEKAVTMMYYPWWNASQAIYWNSYIQNNSPEYISLDTCEGGMLCPPEDSLCPEKHIELLLFIEQEYNSEWEKVLGNCEYRIYKRTENAFMK